MISEAKNRFTLLGYEYEGRPRHGLSASKTYSDRWTIYICPRCHTETVFEWPDFEKHAGKNFSNLMYQDRMVVEREAASHLKDANAFVDFYCQGCNGIVRAYYRYESPQEKQSAWLELITVVERSQSIVKPY